MDPLYQWKKHSGFKKGLATDIVLGDLRKWTGPIQYNSTMHSDFNTDNSQGLSSFKAGRKPEQNISFGDTSTENKARFESLTSNDFKPPPHERDIVASSKPGSLNKLESNTIEKYHSKPLNSTSSAHIGLQTRQALPIDDKHFKCFTTSNTDTYINFSNSIKKDKDAITIRGSSIRQGDLNHISSYKTMHGRSYVLHPNEAYHIQHAKVPRQSSIVLGQKYNSPKLLGEDDMYTSTSSATYQAQESSRQEIVKPRLNSSVVFGEVKSQMSDPSVTQRDYTNHSQKLVNEVDGFASAPQKVRNSSGIITAFTADPKMKFNTESCTAMTYKTPSHENNERSAGLFLGKRETSGLSSVPFGDPQSYPIGMFDTTNGYYFNPHYGFTTSHPILGAKSTKSQVTFGDYECASDATDRFISTTHLAFVQHPESVAALGRGVSVKPTTTLKESDDQDYSMEHNVTTHADHYKFPKLTTERVYGQTAKTVPRKMLFPLRCFNEFGTVTSDSFTSRQGLLFNEAQAAQEAERKAVLRQVRTKSSVAFGDPSLTYFENEQIKA
jgi:hypothetical protein